MSAILTQGRPQVSGDAKQLMPRAKKPKTERADPPAPPSDPEAGETWRKPRQQVGTLPFRFDDEGRLRVMLITSRESRRWVIPKGWPMRGLKPHRAAEREAYEEAGLEGRIGKTAVGVYTYQKRLPNGPVVPWSRGPVVPWSRARSACFRFRSRGSASAGPRWENATSAG